MQASDNTTWWDCYRCAFNYVENIKNYVRHECESVALFGPPEFRNCSAPHFGFVEHGLYAAQLAWWLRFFPPERFYIISAWQLRDPAEAIRVRLPASRATHRAHACALRHARRCSAPSAFCRLCAHRQATA
jgi:hypothetical protein